jgi:TM2 domain-containing membrane protein YozV
MDCVNHSGVAASAYCQNCGKPLCASCVRHAAGGQILCEPCLGSWQAFQQPFVVPPSGPNPWVAAGVGVIPGVGAMYNGQFFKGLIHVVIFALLISITEYHGIFGLFIGFWCLYQSFEAFHTAKALREGQPPPDPLGLNEVGNWLNLGSRPRYPNQPGTGPIGGPVQPNPNPGFAPGYQPNYEQGAWQTPFTPPPVPPPGTAGPGFTPAPGFNPDPAEYGRPLFWKRKEPIGAVILIGLGLVFLLDRLDIFHGRLLEFAWPVLLIGVGVWMIVRRLGDSQGGSK